MEHFLRYAKRGIISCQTYVASTMSKGQIKIISNRIKFTKT